MSSFSDCIASALCKSVFHQDAVLNEDLFDHLVRQANTETLTNDIAFLIASVAKVAMCPPHETYTKEHGCTCLNSDWKCSSVRPFHLGIMYAACIAVIGLFLVHTLASFNVLYKSLRWDRIVPPDKRVAGSDLDKVPSQKMPMVAGFKFHTLHGRTTRAINVTSSSGS